MSDAIPAARLTLSVPRWAVPAGMVPAAAVLIGGNAAGRPWLAAAIVVVQAVLVAGWLTLLKASVDAAALVVVAIAVSDVVLLRTESSTGGSIVGVIGLSVVAVLLHQLALRRRRAVTTSVATNLSAIAVASAAALLLPLRALAEGRSIVYASVISAAAALAVARLLAGESEVRDLLARLAGLAAAAAAALAIGSPSGGLTTGDALAAGLTSAVAALLVDRVIVRVAAARWREAGAWALVVISVLVPLALASPIGYLAGRIIAPNHWWPADA